MLRNETSGLTRDRSTGRHEAPRVQQEVQDSRSIGRQERLVVHTAERSKQSSDLERCEAQSRDTGAGAQPLVDAHLRHLRQALHLLRQQQQQQQEPEENVFMSRLQVVPWGVLGTQITSYNQEAYKAPLPDATIAIVDPAGLPYIQKHGPSRAGGASGALYKWLGIIYDNSFPKAVQKAITKELDAHYHTYGKKKVIHCVGPDLRQAPYLGSDCSVVVKALSKVYLNILAEFARAPDISKLRILPVSSGVFGGEFGKLLPEMTATALALGFRQLSAAERQRVLSASALDLCIFNEKDYQTYSEALKPSFSRP